MPTISAPGYEAEAAALHKNISNLVKEIRRKAASRRQQEDLFILSSTHERRIRALFSHQFSSIHEVSKLLINNGEDEVIENECLVRCRSFIKKRGQLLHLAAQELKNTVDLLLETTLLDSVPYTLKDSKGDALSGKNVHSSELQELRYLHELGTFLHCITASSKLNSLFPSSAHEDVSCLADEENLNVCEKLVGGAIINCQDQLSKQQTRLQAAERELAQLKAIYENDAGSWNDDQNSPDAFKDENKIALAKKALDSLQANHETWLERKREVDFSISAMGNKLEQVKESTAVCKRTIDTLNLSTKEVERSANEAKTKCTDLASELSSKERDRVSQVHLLTEIEERYENLQSLVSDLVEDNSAKAVRLNDIEFKRRELLALLNSVKRKAALVEADNEDCKELIETLRSEKETLSEEIQYLEGLVSNKADLERLMCCSPETSKQTHSSPEVVNYLNFVSKARAIQRVKPITN